MLPRADVTTSAHAPEIWKPIPEFTGYEASDLGRIRSFWKQDLWSGYGGITSYLSTEPRVLKHKTQNKGYHEVRIRHDSGKIRDMRVNRLVLMAFVGPCPDGMVACHDPDPDRSNNRLKNLRWDTHQENIRDAGRHGTKKVLGPEQLAEVARLIYEGYPACEIADRLGVQRSCITRVVRREGFGKPKRWVPMSKFDESMLEEMSRMRRDGLSDREIARRLGIGKASIWRQLGPRSPAQPA